MKLILTLFLVFLCQFAEPKNIVENGKIQTKDSDYKVYGEYNDFFSSKWKVVVVNNGLDKDKLMSLARKIFNENKKTRFEIFDSKEKIKEYIRLQKSLVDSRIKFNQDSINSEWISKHRIATINDRSSASNDTNIWQLTTPYPDNKTIFYLDSSNPVREKKLSLSSQLQSIIRSQGYRCDTVNQESIVPFRWSMKTGYHIYCNDYRYGYDLEDNGGKIEITVK
jgi:hypothetical protein